MVWVLGFSACPWRSLVRPLPQVDADSAPSLTEMVLGLATTLTITRPRDYKDFPEEASLEPFPRGDVGAGSVPEGEPGPKRPRTAQAPGFLADTALQEVFRAGMPLRRSVFVSGHCPGPTAPRRSVARTIFPFDGLARTARPAPVHRRKPGRAGAPSVAAADTPRGTTSEASAAAPGHGGARPRW